MRLYINDNITVLKTRQHTISLKKKHPPFIRENSTNTEYTNSDFNRSGLFIYNELNDSDLSPQLQEHQVVASAVYGNQLASIMQEGNSLALVTGMLPDKIILAQETIILNQLVAPEIDWKNYSESGDETDNEFPDEFDDDFDDEVDENRNNIQGIPEVAINKWGIAVACNHTGIVALKRHGAKEFILVRRCAGIDGEDIFAAPTALGVLITINSDGRYSTFIHLAENGDRLGFKESYFSPPAIVLENHYLICDQEEDYLYLLDDQLSVITKKRFDTFDVVCESACTIDGKKFAFAGDTQIVTGRIDGRGKIHIADPFAYLKFISDEKRRIQIEESEKIFIPQRLQGNSSLGFALLKPIPPWKVTRGSKFELPLTVQSHGGAGVGIKIMITGDALRNVEIESIVINDRVVRFMTTEENTLQAEVAELIIPAGIMYPFKTEPKNNAQRIAADLAIKETQIDMVIMGVARIVTAAALMTLKMSVLGSNAHEMKYTSMLTIR